MYTHYIYIGIYIHDICLKINISSFPNSPVDSRPKIDGQQLFPSLVAGSRLPAQSSSRGAPFLWSSMDC